MTWWLWMVAGAAAAAVAFIAFITVMNWIDDRVSARRRAISSQQSAAEQQMQRAVQNTIQEMFKTARRWQP